MVCQHLNPHKLAAGNCTESLHLKWINLCHLPNGSLLSTPPWLKLSYSCSENYHLAKQCFQTTFFILPQMFFMKPMIFLLRPSKTWSICIFPGTVRYWTSLSKSRTETIFIPSVGQLLLNVWEKILA